MGGGGWGQQFHKPLASACGGYNTVQDCASNVGVGIRVCGGARGRRLHPPRVGQWRLFCCPLVGRPSQGRGGPARVQACLLFQVVLVVVLQHGLGGAGWRSRFTTTGASCAWREVPVVVWSFVGTEFLLSYSALVDIAGGPQPAATPPVSSAPAQHATPTVAPQVTRVVQSLTLKSLASIAVSERAIDRVHDQWKRWCKLPLLVESVVNWRPNDLGPVLRLCHCGLLRRLLLGPLWS